MEVGPGSSRANVLEQRVYQMQSRMNAMIKNVFENGTRIEDP
jgi:hypothetical protein